MQREAIRLTSDAIANARHMGIEMAVTDLVIRPKLQRAVQFAGFGEFQYWHRQHWEHSYRFETHWQQRLFRLAYREAVRSGVADTQEETHWFVWHSDIYRPLATIMWEAWEQEVSLERQFREEILRSAALRRGARVAEGLSLQDEQPCLRLRPEETGMYAAGNPPDA